MRWEHGRELEKAFDELRNLDDQTLDQLDSVTDQEWDQVRDYLGDQVTDDAWREVEAGLENFDKLATADKGPPVVSRHSSMTQSTSRR